MTPMLRSVLLGIIAAVHLISTPVVAAELGQVTNLPVPRFVSLKAANGNVRRGPSLTHRIDWVFNQRDMPLRITAEYDNWRRVEDRDGMGGWMHYSLLSGTRTVLMPDPNQTPLSSLCLNWVPSPAWGNAVLNGVICGLTATKAGPPKHGFGA